MRDIELTRPQVTAGLISEFGLFADLISGLSAAEWDTPTRCDGWAVRDIAGHVTGNAVDTGDLKIGTRSPDEQARDLRGHQPAELAAMLTAAATRTGALLHGLSDRHWDRPSPVPDRTIGNGVLTLWSDAVVHGDDIRVAIGRPSEPGPGLVASVLWFTTELERKGWPGARLLLDGMPEMTIGSGTAEVRSDPLRFVLAAAGRVSPTGLGLDHDVNVYR